MGKYIDAGRLKAEIERLYAEHSSRYGMDEAAIVLDKLENFIDSLQQEQPEVDLEKEIDRFWDSCIKHKNERGGNVIWSNKIEIEALARYFWNKGYNARKED